MKPMPLRCTGPERNPLMLPGAMQARADELRKEGCPRGLVWHRILDEATAIERGLEAEYDEEWRLGGRPEAEQGSEPPLK